MDLGIVFNYLEDYNTDSAEGLVLVLGGRDGTVLADLFGQTEEMAVRAGQPGHLAQQLAVLRQLPTL